MVTIRRGNVSQQTGVYVTLQSMTGNNTPTKITLRSSVSWHSLKDAVAFHSPTRDSFQTVYNSPN